MLLLPRMMNSKHSVEPLLFPSSLSITNSLSIISQSLLSLYFWSGVRSTTTKKKLKKIPIFANYRLKLSWGLCTKDLLFMPWQHQFYNNCNDQEGQKLFKTTSCYSWKNTIRQNETFPATSIRLRPNWSHRRWRAAAAAAATCSWCCWRLTAAGPLFRSTCTVCRKSFFESAEPSQSAGWLTAPCREGDIFLLLFEQLNNRYCVACTWKYIRCNIWWSLNRQLME